MINDRSKNRQYEINHTTLSEAIELVIDYRGKTPKKLGGDWSTSGYRALSAKNIKTGSIVQPETIRYVDEDLYKKWMKDEVQRGDILITSEAPFGQIYYWNSDEKIVLSQRIFALRTKKEFCSKYLYYYMTTPEFQGELDARATGTTVIGLRQPELLKCKIKYPPVEVQRKIAGVLGALDDKIELNNKINQNLELQAQALFKSWFVDFEPFGGTMPSDWKNGKLGDFIEIKRGGSPRPIQNYLVPKGLNWLKISDATAETSPYILEVKEHIKQEGLSKTVFLQKGALVLSNSATPGIPKFLNVDSCIHDGWLYFPKSQLSKEYLFLLFNSIRKDLIAFGNGSVFTNLKTDILRNYKAVLPAKEVLQNFDNTICPIFDLIRRNREEIATLTALRDTLLPKLMSGEINVDNVKVSDGKE